jgi:hypothetical protein
MECRVYTPDGPGTSIRLLVQVFPPSGILYVRSNW